MKKLTVQQEILLVINTYFIRKHWCEKVPPVQQWHLSPAEQLEEACWNGFLNEFLPEVLEKTGAGKRIFLWQVKQGAFLLQLELSEFPMPLDKHASIDMDAFLPTLVWN